MILTVRYKKYLKIVTKKKHLVTITHVSGDHLHELFYFIIMKGIDIMIRKNYLRESYSDDSLPAIIQDLVQAANMMRGEYDSPYVDDIFEAVKRLRKLNDSLFTDIENIYFFLRG